MYHYAMASIALKDKPSEVNQEVAPSEANQEVAPPDVNQEVATSEVNQEVAPSEVNREVAPSEVSSGGAAQELVVVEQQQVEIIDDEEEVVVVNGACPVMDDDYHAEFNHLFSLPWTACIINDERGWCHWEKSGRVVNITFHKLRSWQADAIAAKQNYWGK